MAGSGGPGREQAPAGGAARAAAAAWAPPGDLLATHLACGPTASSTVLPEWATNTARGEFMAGAPCPGGYSPQGRCSAHVNGAASPGSAAGSVPRSKGSSLAGHSAGRGLGDGGAAARTLDQLHDATGGARRAWATPSTGWPRMEPKRHVQLPGAARHATHFDRRAAALHTARSSHLVERSPPGEGLSGVWGPRRCDRRTGRSAAVAQLPWLSSPARRPSLAPLRGLPGPPTASQRRPMAAGSHAAAPIALPCRHRRRHERRPPQSRRFGSVQLRAHPRGV